jgi:hypothetical protein
MPQECGVPAETCHTHDSTKRPLWNFYILILKQVMIFFTKCFRVLVFYWI